MSEHEPSEDRPRDLPQEASPEEGPLDQSQAAEALLLSCFDDADVEGAVARTCAENPALATNIRKVYKRLHDFRLTPKQESSSVTSSLLPGRAMPPQIESYEIRERIGEGGMGIVYRAWNSKLGREVAIKVVHPRLVHLTGKRLRFQREVEAIARLSHPNIVPVLEVGETEGIPWFAMESIEGASLSEILKALRDLRHSSLSASSFFDATTRSGTGDDTNRTRSPLLKQTWVDACLEIAIQVARALEHAHARGVLHRDVKPSNVMVTPDGRALLLDFGLARTEEDEDLGLTRSSSEIGSLPYMAPELLRGNAIPNPRLDVYGLGVTLYELLARENPYLDKSAEGTRKRVLEGNAKQLRKLSPQVNWDLETVCMKAMAPESEQRYANMAALRADLERVRDRLPIEAKRANVFLRLRRWQQRNPVFSAGLATALVLVAIASLALFVQERRARDSAEILETIAREQSARAERMLQGTQLAFARALLLAKNSTGAMSALERIPKKERGWVWHHLERMTDMSERRGRAHDAHFKLAVTPDGKSMITSDGAGLCYRIEVDSGAKNRLDVPSFAEPGISPDGRLLVGGIKANGDRQAGEIFVFDLEKERITHRFAAGACTRSPAFGARGASVLALSDHGELAIWALEAGGAAKPVRRWHAHELKRPGRPALLFRDKKRTEFFTVARTREVKLWKIDGTLRYTIRNRHAPIVAMSVTRDESKLLLAHSSFFTTARRRITAWNCADGGTVWSWRPGIRTGVLDIDPGGRYFASGNRSLEITELATRDIARRLFGHADGVTDVRWLPDGRLLSTDRSGMYRVWRLGHLPHATVYAAHASSVTALAVLPDGRHVVSGSSTGAVAIGDTESLQVQREAQLDKARVQTIVQGDAGESVVVQQNGVIHVCDSRELSTLRKHAIGERTLRATRIDETRILALTASGVLHLVDHKSGRSSKRRLGDTQWSALSYADGLIALGANDGRFACWRAELRGASLSNVREPAAEMKFEDHIVCLKLARDATKAMVALENGALYWIEAERGTVLRSFVGHGARPSDIVINADASRMYSTAWNATFMAWHPDLEEAILFDSPGRAMLLSLAEHPEGHFVAVGGLDGRVQLMWGKPRALSNEPLDASAREAPTPRAGGCADELGEAQGVGEGKAPGTRGRPPPGGKDPGKEDAAGTPRGGRRRGSKQGPRGCRRCWALTGEEEQARCQGRRCVRQFRMAMPSALRSARTRARNMNAGARARSALGGRASPALLISNDRLITRNTVAWISARDVS